MSKDRRTTVLVTEDDLEELKDAAAGRGQSYAAFMRAAGLGVAREELVSTPARGLEPREEVALSFLGLSDRINEIMSDGPSDWSVMAPLVERDFELALRMADAFLEVSRSEVPL